MKNSLAILRSRTFLTRVFVLTAVSVGMLLSVGASVLAQVADNGIVVGQAKLYDERSLESMLGSLQEDLTKSSYINSAAVSANEGMLQGGELSSSQFSVRLAQPSSGLAGTAPPATAAPAAAPATSAATTTATNPATTTVAPAPTPVPAPAVRPAANEPSFTSSSVGISAPLAISSEDMLQQQLALSFEATNLKMLLEHALSDRVIFKSANGTAVPRALAVLGFQITVEPRSEDKYSVAEAEITVKNPPNMAGLSDASDRPQVAMMLPQDKTYNVAKVTSNSTTIGLAAFAQPIVGSLSAGSSRNGAYIAYDVDTIALQRPSTDANSVTFAWQFRPVLGEKSVQPGTRQVYVLLSLPVSSGQDYAPDISVKTYWKKLDTKSGTVSDDCIADRISNYPLDSISIHKLNDYDDGLRPTIDNIDMYEAGNDQVYIEASGANFTKNMSVVLNGVGGSFFEQGGRLLSFTAPISALSYSNPRIVGPYGLPVDLVAPTLRDASGAAISATQADEGLHIKDVSVVPLDGANSDVSIKLVSKNDYTKAPALPANAQLVVTVGDQVYGLDSNPVALGSDSDDTHVTLNIRVPNSALQAAQKVTVRYLFAGDDYRSDFQLPVATFSIDSVNIVSCDPDPSSPTKMVRSKEHPTAGVQRAVQNTTTPSVVLALNGNFQSTLTAYLYNGSEQVEFDPTVPVFGSFLLLQAKTSAWKTATASATSSDSGRGPVAPVPGGSAPNPGKCYNLALLTAERSQLTGSSYIVLYEPNTPAVVEPLADCARSMAQWDASGTWVSPAPSGVATTLPAPVSTTTAPPPSSTPTASEAQSGAAAPTAAPPPPIAQMGTTTVTGTANRPRMTTGK